MKNSTQLSMSISQYTVGYTWTYEKLYTIIYKYQAIHVGIYTEPWENLQDHLEAPDNTQCYIEKTKNTSVVPHKHIFLSIFHLIYKFLSKFYHLNIFLLWHERGEGSLCTSGAHFHCTVCALVQRCFIITVNNWQLPSYWILITNERRKNTLKCVSVYLFLSYFL